MNVVREIGARLLGSLAKTVLLAGMIAVMGCAGAQFNGTEYRDADVAFRLDYVPTGFREIESGDSKVALQNDNAGSTIAVSARCGVDSDDVPLRALVQHLFIQFTEREVLREEEHPLDGRVALTMEMEAYLDGVKRHFVVTVLKKDGCVYDFLHIDGGGSSGALEQSRGQFRKLVAGFSTLD